MDAVAQIEVPKNVSEVRSFLGLVSYYRRFIRGFVERAAPLHSLLHKDHPWNWTPECQKAYEDLKNYILNRPVSAYPDFSKTFRVYTDASNVGIVPSWHKIKMV